MADSGDLRPVVGGHQVVAYTGTAGTSTAIASADTVRVVLTTAGFVAIGPSPTATTSDIYMPADHVEYFRINKNDKVSAIQSASGGNLHVTPMSIG